MNKMYVEPEILVEELVTEEIMADSGIDFDFVEW